jgi:hypothetical protein
VARRSSLARHKILPEGIEGRVGVSRNKWCARVGHAACRRAIMPASDGTPKGRETRSL